MSGPKPQCFILCLTLIYACDAGTLNTRQLSQEPNTPNEPSSAADAGSTNTVGQDAGTPQNPPTTSEQLFDTTRVVEVRLEMADADWTATLANPQAEIYYPGNIVFDGNRVDDVEIRIKGNSSLNAVARSGGDRYSFKVDINRQKEDQELFGKKKLNFNNGYHDPSMMREHLAYEVMAGLGLPASRTAFVDLWLNQEHMGLYTVVEHVDGSYIKERFSNPDGDLYKPENPGGDLVWRGSDMTSYSGLEIKRNEDTTDHSAVLGLIASLNHESGSKDLLDVLDTDMALRYLASLMAMSIYDSYIGSSHNYYLYEEEGKFTVIPWDLNGAFAIFNCGCDRQGMIDFKIDEPVCGPLDQKPLVKELLDDPTRLATYHNYLLELIDGPLSVQEMTVKINKVADMIRPYVAADERSFYSVDEFNQNLSTDIVEANQRVLPGLTAFLEDRSASIRAQLNGTKPSTNNGAGNCRASGGGGGGQQQDVCGDGMCSRRERRDRSCPQDCD